MDEVGAGFTETAVRSGCTGCVLTRFIAQCIPSLARLLCGFIDRAFCRYAILACGEDTAASHNHGSSIFGLILAAILAQYLVLEWSP
jgi:hypothetical protein